MITGIWQVFLFTMLPIVELRGGIPLGILTYGLPWHTVFLIAYIANVLAGVIVYISLKTILNLFLRVKLFARLYHKRVEKVQKKIHKYVELYGAPALALFIAIPLPMSGAWTGALAAHIIGMGFKRFLVSLIIGIFAAAIIVTAITLSGASAFQFFINA